MLLACARGSLVDSQAPISSGHGNLLLTRTFFGQACESMPVCLPEGVKAWLSFIWCSMKVRNVLCAQDSILGEDYLLVGKHAKKT